MNSHITTAPSTAVGSATYRASIATTSAGARSYAQITVDLRTPDYSDEQFFADLANAGGPLKAMADKARADLRAGLTRRFPS